MKQIFTLLSSIFIANLSYSQILGTYEFTGAAECPVVNNYVTTQPLNASFTTFDASGLTCVPTQNVFNNSGWNPATTIDLTKYYEFTIITDLNFVLNLDSLIFTSRISSNTATWYVRSSVDNFATDIATGNSTNILDTIRLVLPASHQNLIDASFRFYVSSVTDDQRAWRIDDVIVKGEVVTETNSTNELTENNYNIFPNPGNESLTISDKFNSQDINISIFTSEGKFLSEYNNVNTINTSLLEKGVYFIKVNENGNVKTFNWVKN